MTVIVGIAALLLGLVCWVGQSLVYFSPETAEKFGVKTPFYDVVFDFVLDAAVQADQV